MKKYPIKPEIIVLAGTAEVEKFRIPEVKVRFNRGRLFDNEKVTSSKDGYDILKRLAGSMIQTQEMGLFLYLNRANKLIGYYKHTIGGTAGTVFDIKLIMAGAVKCLAHGIIACHNHPSGNLQPSDADIRLTKQLKKAAEVHDINLLDHIIITKEGYKSFADEGYLNGLTGLKGVSNMITRENYNQEIKNVKISDLPETLQDSHKFMLEYADLYGQDKDIDEMIDLYLKQLNKTLEKQGKTKAEKPEKTKRKPTEKREKPEKVKKVKIPKEDNSKKVTYFDDDMKIIRRFVPIIGKTKPVRSIMNLYKTIQKAITEERITKKNSSFHGIVSNIQEKLLSAINLAKNSKAEMIQFKIQDNAFVNKVRDIVKLEKVYDSVKLIKRYISLQGKETREKAGTLHNLISKALLNYPETKYSQELEAIKRQLDAFIQGKDPKIEPPVELHGLFGLTGQKKKQVRTRTV